MVVSNSIIQTREQQSRSRSPSSLWLSDVVPSSLSSSSSFIRKSFSRLQGSNNENNTIITNSRRKKNNRSSTESTVGTVSMFDVSRIPRDIIRKRELHSYSVHYSMQASKYIATISRYSAGEENGNINESNKNKTEFVQFQFSNEREANKFAKAYSPPKLMDIATTTNVCQICTIPFAVASTTSSSQNKNSRITTSSNSRNRLHHYHQGLGLGLGGRVGRGRKNGGDNTNTTKINCRNCGVCICRETCSIKWGRQMVPKTFIRANYQATTVRVCKACDWLTNAFCLALLQGKYNDVIQLYKTNNINLRTCFANINKEAMFPIHCAVIGGSLDIVKWLVDVQGCPIIKPNMEKDPRTNKFLSIKTSSNRTVIDLAMSGKVPKFDILSYLIRQKGLSIMDTKDAATLVPKTLEALLITGAGDNIISNPSTNHDIIDISSRRRIVDEREDSKDNYDDNDEFNSSNNLSSSNCEESLTIIEDACNLCYERTIDCVLTPCGHQICCTVCASKISACPICKEKCTTLRIFRQ